MPPSPDWPSTRASSEGSGGPLAQRGNAVREECSITTLGFSSRTLVAYRERSERPHKSTRTRAIPC